MLWMKALKASFLIILIACSINSKAQFRKYSNEFLNIGAGARGISMGGAQAASVADGTAGYWNPAGLVNVKNTQINLMHSEYFAGIGKYDFANAAIPTTNSKRTIGATALRFAVDDIMNTLFLVEPDGTINYNNIRPFSSADYAFLLSYAQQLGQATESKAVNFGVNAKVIHRSVGSFAKAWGFGLDAGLQIFKDRWRFGIVGKDITTTFNTWSFSFTDKEKEALYLTKNDIPVKSTEMTSPRLLLGIGRQFPLGKSSSLLAETNFDVTFDGKRNTAISSDPISVDPKLGLEYGYKDVFFVRGGINNFQKALADGDTLNQKKVWIYQPSAGAGFRVGPVVIDYAFANLANQSNPLFTHVISLRANLGKRGRAD